MIRHAISMALAVATLATPHATAQSATAVTDREITQCIIAIHAVSLKLTGIDQAKVDGVAFYFVGKLAVRHTPAEIKMLIARAEAETAKMELAPVAKDCVSELKELSTILQDK